MRRSFRAAPVVLLIVSVSMLVAARRSASVPQYAARTGLMCGSCHFDPNGGGPRNDFGFAFAKNRHSIQPEDSTSAWKDLTLTNRIGDNFPLYVGLNHRFMAITNTTTKSDSLDRAGFYNMESAIYLTFQPHSRLTMVYSRDGFGGGSSTKDAFGMIGGFPLDGYLKAGRFRTPFGMRLDDHTVATRNGFLDFFGPTVPFGYGDSLVLTFLPYDPRQPDTGIEYGSTWKSFFGRVALTDGASDPLSPGISNYAGAKTVKLGYNNAWYQGGVSLYDDFRRGDAFSGDAIKRATRWGYSGIFHRGPAALLGEIAAGTDERRPATGITGPKRNSLAGFAEVDYWPLRQLNTRLRYDYMSLDRGNRDPYIRELNQHTRYAVEAEWVPVPFAELRWTLRKIDHKASAFRDDGFGQKIPIKDETQSYLQLHFSY